MTGAVAKYKYHYFRCNNSRGTLKPCNKEQIDKYTLDDIVIKENRRLLTKNNIKVADDCVMECIEKDLTEIKRIKKQIKNTEKEIESLLASIIKLLVIMLVIYFGLSWKRLKINKTI